jgi:tripartite-type tricarboxylate transporter receptor subunit TctC
MGAVGVNMTHVPFRGFPEEMTALVGGQLDFVFDSITTEWPFATSGKVRPLAVSSAKRIAIAPEIPAIGEVIAGFDASTWQAICAPAGTPDPLLLSLAQDVRQIFTAPDVVALLQNVGGVPLPMQPDEFGRFIVRERAKWAEVVKASGLRID